MTRISAFQSHNFVSYDYLQKPHDLDILNDYYNRTNLSLQVKNKLLEDTNKNIIQNKKYITYINYDFSINLSEYLNDKYKNSSIKINTTFLKIWEILSQFNLIPPTIEKKSLKIVYLDEFSGQIIMCVNHWLKTKCNRFKMDNYEWLANSFNHLNYKIMKRLILCCLMFSIFNKSMTQTSPSESIYDIKINSLAGQPINLSDYKGKYILFVNVASKCGFTGQYEDLQKIIRCYISFAINFRKYILKRQISIRRYAI